MCGGVGEEYSDPDNDYDYGAGNVNLTTNSYTSANNASAGRRTNTRSTKGPLDDCLLWKYGAASWVHHDTYMRFASLYYNNPCLTMTIDFIGSGQSDRAT